MVHSGGDGPVSKYKIVQNATKHGLNDATHLAAMSDFCRTGEKQNGHVVLLNCAQTCTIFSSHRVRLCVAGERSRAQPSMHSCIHVSGQVLCVNCPSQTQIGFFLAWVAYPSPPPHPHPPPPPPRHTHTKLFGVGKNDIYRRTNFLGHL